MIVSKLWLAVYEGDADGKQTPPPPKVEPPVKTFTQEEVNRITAENKRNLQKQNQELVTQLDGLRQTATLTQQERDELSSRIEALQQQYMTKEELAKQDAVKREKKFKEDFDNVSKAATEWQGRYSQLFKEQVITRAADEHKAFSVGQMIDMLSPNTEIVPAVGDDGKPTGQFLAVVPMTVEKEGKREVVKMPVSDAIKTMKAMPDRYGNLFKGDGTPGLGLTSGGNTGANGKIEFDPNMSEEQYAKWRKQQGLT